MLRAMKQVAGIKQFSSSALKGDLFKFQKDLPRLPVPTLAETSAKYLRSVEPFLTPEQLKTTAANVDEFVKPGGAGETLQARLTSFAQDKDNWLAEWWDDYAYMSYRDPVVPYVSYFLSHKDVRNAIGHDQLLKATLISYYTLQFMQDVQNETLEPEIIKGNPYCMNAFHYMFNNSRVPAGGSDITKKYDFADHRYFVVIHKNHFYKVYHHTRSGQALSKPDIFKQLSYILHDASTKPRGLGLGALTSLNRDEWLKSYQSLVKSPVNEASLETIFASSFVLCLDDHSPVTIEEKSRNCWHGDGQNRWFDKPLEFFVAANGNSGFLGEHSRMDATPTVQMNNFIMDSITKEDPKKLLAEITANNSSVAEVDVEALPTALAFDISPVVRQDVADAIAKFNETVNSLDEEIFQYYGYGKNLIKQFKVSPDAYVQMMIQLAYYKLTGKIRPTYESAATRKYLKGRTETGRSVSKESAAFVKTWTNPESTVEEKIDTFNKACKQHVTYLTEAADGRGVDRHLFGLKQMLQPGEPVPAIFQDPVFSYSGTWYISTSQVPSEHLQSWGWSQVIDEGFGLAYLVNKDWIHTHISCKKGNGLRSDLLKWYLTDSANEMKEVLSTQLAPKAKL
ncbi:Carnitine O-acetyltransferase mitochondrial [Meyerozyma sp. JA9]|nr:Carnitine O-acetyltransferase mitochondrial [Meyerozyma sp. JA9]